MAAHPHLRLGLLGGECTGKSALADRIAIETGAHVVGEYLRTFVETERRSPRPEEQPAIFETQRAWDNHPCPTPMHVADPIPGMTAVYSSVYFDDQSLLDLAIEDSTRFDLLIWCDTDIPWEPDGAQRDGPEFRAAAHAVLAERVVPRLRSAGLPVLTVGGTVDERWGTVRDHLPEAWQP